MFFPNNWNCIVFEERRGPDQHSAQHSRLECTGRFWIVGDMDCDRNSRDEDRSRQPPRRMFARKPVEAHSARRPGERHPPRFAPFYGFHALAVWCGPIFKDHLSSRRDSDPHQIGAVCHWQAGGMDRRDYKLGFVDKGYPLQD